MNYLQDHRFFERLQTLNSLNRPDHDLAETLDRDFQRASHHAARKCSTKNKPPWSPHLAQAWAELHYFRLLIASQHNSVNYLPAIRKLQKEWPELPTLEHSDFNQIKELQRRSLQKLKDARNQAQKLREEFLTKKHALYTCADDPHKAKILRRIIRAESQHRVYNKIRRIRNDSSNSFSLNSLKVPKDRTVIGTETIKTLPDTPEFWETTTIPEDIENLLIQRNREHFGQAEGTPFTTAPLSVDVGYKADGYAAELILSGNMGERNNMTAATSLLIKHLQRKTINVLDGNITEEQVLQKLRHWDEKTTTSPSGVHLGHYHCCWRDPKMHPADPDREKLLHQQKLLLQSTTSLLNYALKFGYAFNRWTTIVNVMLQKDPGNPRIHRLRVIHIYEADYNLLLAVKWRQVSHHAEDNRLLNPGMYGSRPGRSAHDPAFLEVIQNEIYRMSMKPGINFDLDAASCYDRIPINLAVISSRRVGMSPQVTTINALTLEQARYHLKTTLGTSEQFYSHSLASPIHGTGQGSGNSPMIWCLLCSALFDAFESSAHGASFTDYSNQIHVPIHMIGFVDDCTQRVNMFNDHPPPASTALIDLMEKDAQLWNDLLWASGGALEQSKCSYHMIESDWTTNGHPFLRGGTCTPSISIHHNGRTTRIQQRSNYESHKTLGCHINPAYTRNQPWKSITKKNEQFAQLLETNSFTREETWTFYTAIYLPSLTYSLPITPLTKEQCGKIDTRFLRSLLPRCGYNRNMSRAIRYAPFHVGGAGFKEMYTIQGALMLQQVYKYLNSPETPIGKMLLIAISWTQAFVGTSELFLTNPHLPIPPAGPSYLLDLRLFLQRIHGSIHLHNSFNSTMLRQGDRSIMDIILSQERWTNSQVSQLNACRRYLQVQTVADITNLTGTRILSSFFSDVVHPDPTRIRVALFNQKAPNDKSWKLWRRFLLTIGNKHGVLYQPLHHWTKDVTHLRYWPTYLYDPITDTLMSHFQKDEYHIHLRHYSGCFSIRPTNEVIRPTTGYPTATTIIMDTLRPTKNFLSDTDVSSTTINIGIPSPVCVQQWEQDLLGQCQPLTTIDSLAHHISSGQITSCSDGSATAEVGSFGFLIAANNETRLLRGYGPAPGAFPNSFRSEAYGVLATLRWLHHAFTMWPCHNPISITHYLDNKSVIRRVENTLKYQGKFPNTRLLPEQDVIDEIVATIQGATYTVEFKWVKGHQDTNTPVAHLSFPAQLNCEADQAADLWQNEYPISIIPSLPSTPCQLRIQQKSISGHLKRHIHDAVTIPMWFKHLQERFQWNDEVLATIDWDLYKCIIKKYKDKWTTIVKHLHMISPTGHIAHRNNPYAPHDCPVCNTPHENNNHIITCPHHSRATWRHQTLMRVTTHAQGFVDPYLVDILQDGLARFHRKLPLIASTLYPPRYQPLIDQQNEIGWDHLYRGKWCTQWSIMQDNYTLTRSPGSNPPIKGQTWVLEIGRILIDQWLLLWKQRNDDRHGADNKYQSATREQTLRAEIYDLYNDLYNHRLSVCPSDRSIFYNTAEDHLSKHTSLDALEDWILNYRPIIMASVELADRLGIAQNNTLLTYPTFNPILQVSRQASLTAGLPAG